MRRLVLGVSLLVAGIASAGPQVRNPVESFPPLVLGGEGGSGNACTVGVFVLTAGHVADQKDLKWRVGNEAGPTELIHRYKEDLATVRLLRPDGGGYTALPTHKVAEEAPRAGSPLRALVTLVSGSRTVLHLRAMYVDEDEHLLLDGMAFPGVSGSCIIDENDEVVAVYAGHIAGHIAGSDIRSIGYAVPVWGRKLP